MPKQRYLHCDVAFDIWSEKTTEGKFVGWVSDPRHHVLPARGFFDSEEAALDAARMACREHVDVYYKKAKKRA